MVISQDEGSLLPGIAFLAAFLGVATTVGLATMQISLQQSVLAHSVDQRALQVAQHMDQGSLDPCSSGRNPESDLRWTCAVEGNIVRVSVQGIFQILGQAVPLQASARYAVGSE